MSHDDDEQLGAGWWRESLTLGGFARRSALAPLGLLGGAALGLGGCYEYDNRGAEMARADEVDRDVDALTLQRENGWNVGRPDQPLAFTGSSLVDVSGQQGWRSSMETLSQALAPAQPAYWPWYVPTLFQSLAGEQALMLRAVMRPVRTEQMDEDFQRGLAIRQLFEQAGWPRDTAIVVDAPGPRSVAVAAALADHFDPVFAFGNWPHPLGVVPSHETLGAALYYRPLFERERNARPVGTPPVWVLDANRLAPYTDADAQFDNRYFVRLPDANALKTLGIQHLLYVSVDGTRELDDLNDAFVQLQSTGVDVKMLALDEFVQDPSIAVAQNDDDDDVDPAWYPTVEVTYCWGGWWGLHDSFWSYYGWYPNAIGRPIPHGVTIGPPSGVRHPLLHPVAVHWTPTARPTLFTGLSASTFAPARLAHFGHVQVLASRADGHITGVRAGRTGSFGGGTSFARSGSIGRAGVSLGGG